MKATLDIPDDLHRKVKARSALLGRSIRDVTIELYQRWLGEAVPESPEMTSEQWLDEWLRLGEDAVKDAPHGPTASEILARDRNRLDRG